MNTFGEVPQCLEKYNEAEQLHQKTLQLKEEVLGKEHPFTLDNMNNLALMLHNPRSYSEAEHIHREEWKLSEKVLGRDHPDTLKSIHNLALTLDNQGKI
jgi:hypothetical protein